MAKSPKNLVGPQKRSETDNYLELLLAAKDAEIQRLLEEKNRLEDRLLALLDPQALASYKLHSSDKVNRIPRKPMVIDEKSGLPREKTSQEISEEFKALKELGILS